MCVFALFQRFFTIVISEPQGSSLDMGSCSTVRAGSHFAFPSTKMLTRRSRILAANCRMKPLLNTSIHSHFCDCCVTFEYWNKIACQDSKSLILYYVCRHNLSTSLDCDYQCRMFSFNCTCSFSLFSMVSSLVYGWIVSLLGPSQCAITGILVAEL